MAVEFGLRDAVGPALVSFHRYAKSLGWKREDYRVLYETNADWGRIHIILVVHADPVLSLEDQWLSVVNFIENDLRDHPETLDSINLVLRTFDQIEEGGLYALSPSYSDSDERITPAGQL